jgi:hypothetical protein
MANRRFNVSEFSAEVGKRGVGRPNYFSVMITLPSKISGFFNTSFLPLRIESASLPARSLETIDQRYHGPTRMVPYAFQYQPMTLRVLLSENMIEREIFMAWQDMSISSGGLASYRRSGGRAPKAGGFDSTYYDEMIGSVEVMQFAESPRFQNINGLNVATSVIRGDVKSLVNDVIDVFNPLNQNIFNAPGDRNVFPQYRVKLEEAYPHTISDVDLDWGADGAAKLNVQMRYFIATERHPDALPFENLYGLESLLRGAVNTLDRFSPLISLFTKNGLSGGVSGLAKQTGVQFRNSLTATRGSMFGI